MPNHVIKIGHTSFDGEEIKALMTDLLYMNTGLGNSDTYRSWMFRILSG